MSATENIMYWVEAVEITPSDTTTYNPPLRGLRVWAAGDVTIVTAGGNSKTITVTEDQAEQGRMLTYMIRKVMADGTDIGGEDMEAGR